MKILAVDPGEKRIGVAISDTTGTLARPYCVIAHHARAKDAQRIVAIAKEENVELIIVGWALDSDGGVGYRARKSQRLAKAIEGICDLPIQMWDESYTTQTAVESRIKLGVSRKKRQGQLDDLAASVLLQDFLINNENLVKTQAVNDES
jgi:putative Holliday junction resolvase